MYHSPDRQNNMNDWPLHPNDAITPTYKLNDETHTCFRAVTTCTVNVCVCGAQVAFRQMTESYTALLWLDWWRIKHFLTRIPTHTHSWVWPNGKAVFAYKWRLSPPLLSLQTLRHFKTLALYLLCLSAALCSAQGRLECNWAKLRQINSHTYTQCSKYSSGTLWK